MQGFHKMHDDLETVIEKDNCTIMDIDSTRQTTELGDSPRQTPELGDSARQMPELDDSARQTPELRDGSLRQKLGRIIHSNTFMVVVIVLVITDMLVVIIELLFDLEVVDLEPKYHVVPKVLHILSVVILGVFLVEIFIRLYVLRLSFFKHKMEMFDAVVVIISFTLDIVFRNKEDATVGVGLLIVLRLWRVTRILNGIVMSVQKQAQKKIAKERERYKACERELMALQEFCSTQKEEIERLQQILHQHNIAFVTNNLSQPISNIQIEIVPDVSSSVDCKENVVVT